MAAKASMKRKTLSQVQLGKQQAYALLKGENFEALMTKIPLILGRRSTSDQAADVDLGTTRSISRKHAIIEWNHDKGVFELRCLGKNGLNVDDEHLSQNDQPKPLSSKARISIGETSFYFLLPLNARPHIASSPAPSKFIARVEAEAAGTATSNADNRETTIESPPTLRAFNPGLCSRRCGAPTRVSMYGCRFEENQDVMKLMWQPDPNDARGTSTRRHALAQMQASLRR